MKRYTVKKTSELSGVSIRTLHFYDEIGLLKPAYYGENGYRYYEREQLLLLQQILFYRKLGFALERIQKILGSPKFDKLEALRAHRKQLQKDAARLGELIRTIDKTITNLQGETTMKDKDLYRGFTPEKQKEYEMYLIDRFGKPAEKNIKESKKRMKSWTRENFERVKQEGGELLAGLASQLSQGMAPSDPAVQQVIARHFQWTCRFWTPNRESYAGLGRLYVEHPDFRKFYDPYHPQLAEFLAEAMRIYAETKLAG